MGLNSAILNSNVGFTSAWVKLPRRFNSRAGSTPAWFTSSVETGLNSSVGLTTNYSGGFNFRVGLIAPWVYLHRGDWGLLQRINWFLLPQELNSVGVYLRHGFYFGVELTPV